MRKSSGRSLHGGAVNLNLFWINDITFLCVMLFNLFKGIVYKNNTVYFLYHVVPFVPALILNIYFQKKKQYKWNAFIYAVIGICSIFGNGTANYSGAVFIIFSFYIFNSRITNIILFTITLVSIVAKNMIFGFTLNNLIGHIIVFGFSFLIYYILIHPKNIETSPSIDYELSEIIKMKSQGLTTKEISDRLYVSPDAVMKKWSRSRKDDGCDNDVQYILKLVKNGQIRP
jgi:DNA-binding CsgD family transcriptional regulator